MGTEAINYTKYFFSSNRKMSINIYLHGAWQCQRTLITTTFYDYRMPLRDIRKMNLPLFKI